MGILIIALVLHAVISALFSAYLAVQKGKDGPTWFFLGLLFGLVALLTLVGVPPEAAVKASATETPATGTLASETPATGTLTANIPAAETPFTEAVSTCAWGDCGREIPEGGYRYTDSEGRDFCSYNHFELGRESAA